MKEEEKYESKAARDEVSNPLDMALSVVEKESSILSSQVQELAKRLSPILKLKYSPELNSIVRPAVGPTDSLQSDIVTRIYSDAEQIRGTQETLSHILEYLEA